MYALGGDCVVVFAASEETPAKLRHSGESRNPEGSGKRGITGFPLGALSTNGFCRGLPRKGDLTGIFGIPG